MFIKFVINQFLFKIIKAAITPGIQPNKVNIKTIKKEPQPLSIIDNGGKIIAKITLSMLIVLFIGRRFH